MAEYIEREAFRDKLRNGTIITDDLYGMGIMSGMDAAIKMLNQIPAADVVEVVHGRWEQIGEADYRCPVCGFRFTSCDPIEMFAYCRCGAKMDGGESDGK